MSCYVKIISGSDLLFTFQYGKSPYVADNQTLINDHKWHQYSWTFVPNDSAAANGTTRIYCGGLNSIGEVLICGWKLEEGNCATPWCEADSEDSSLNNLRHIIPDVSGFNNNASVVGDLSRISPSVRYCVGMYQDNGLTNYIKTDSIYLPTDACTMNIWIKSSNTAPTGNYHDPFCAYSTPASYELSIYKIGYLRAGLNISGTRKVDNCTSTKLLDGNWHMITLTYDGATIKRYVDTVMEKSTAATGTLTSPMNFAFGRYGSGTTYGSKEMSYSDARFYATALTQKQIEELYNTSMSIDKEGNILVREVEE